MEAILFQLGTQTFGIELDDLDEILMMCSLHKIPEAPNFIAGAINLRGSIIPVIDLSQRLGFERPSPPPQVLENDLQQSDYQNNTRMLIVTVNQLRVGMIIDGLQKVVTLSSDDHHEPVVNKAALPEYVDGVFVQGTGMIQMIHIKQAISSEELSVLRNT
ncbi:MAG: Chemotaxis protein cheW [Candidatus Magnetoglobus multicellularis str. Araruama]|uniref:Chemotaxis protein cheW n=1 Tax=Candidatus Magnetoglobus multicellularis str. Araruama TaxID=890399 RepID=A0A1V1PGS7_9BACT|nr:MAG: Chemotaxis protein cheW [Candidatus Magnetoglobus multicellularis str. Araruama]